jgi:hypothetical protein
MFNRIRGNRMKSITLRSLGKVALSIEWRKIAITLKMPSRGFESKCLFAEICNTPWRQDDDLSLSAD